MFLYVGLSPGKTIATFQRNISHHCWSSICNLWRNDRNIICVRLATLLGRVATCWVLKIKLARMPWHNTVARTWPNDYNIMQHPNVAWKFDHFRIWANNTQHVTTCRNTPQQGGQTCCKLCARFLFFKSMTFFSFHYPRFVDCERRFI